MSDDLISRKALMKKFIVSDNGRRIPEYDIDNFPITISVKDVKDIIRKAPTAFDKEKVIEKLKDQYNYSRKVRNKNDNDYFEYWDGRTDSYKDAIEIVEKGGVE